MRHSILKLILWGKSGFGPISWTRIWKASAGTWNMQERAGGKGSVCAGEHAKSQCAENACSKSCRKLSGPAGHLLTAAWCSQGASAWERKGKAYAPGSAGQKASALQHGVQSGAELQQQLPVPSETKGGGWVETSQVPSLPVPRRTPQRRLEKPLCVYTELLCSISLSISMCR